MVFYSLYGQSQSRSSSSGELLLQNASEMQDLVAAKQPQSEHVGLDAALEGFETCELCLCPQSKTRFYLLRDQFATWTGKSSVFAFFFSH